MRRLQGIASSTAKSKQPEYFDFVVVGAGLSGVQSAEILALQGKSVIVLEANDYIGGRVRSQPIKRLPEAAQINWIQKAQKLQSTFLEHGATWLSKEHTFALRWVKELGLNLFEQYSDGVTVYGRSQTDYFQHEALSEVYLAHKDEIMQVLNAVTTLCNNLQQLAKQAASNPTNPVYQRMYSQYIQVHDKITMQSFLERYLKSQKLLELVMHTIQVEECVSCDNLSLFYVISNNGSVFENLRAYLGLQEDGTDELKVKEGTEAIVRGIVSTAEKHLGKPGLVRLSEPVLQILNEEGRLELEVITTKNRYRCLKVIWAVPLATSQHIKVSRLSAAKRMYFENQEQAFAVKIFFIFKRAFWRSRFCGNAYFSEEFPFSELIQNSPANLSCGVLTFFLCAGKIHEWEKRFGVGVQDPEIRERKKQYGLKVIADAFLAGDIHSPELKDAIMVERSYKDNQYIKSCYQSMPRMGLTTDIETKFKDSTDFKTRDEYGIIFVGSEQSQQFATYAEGAIRAGRQKIYQFLRKTDPWLQDNK